MYRLCDVLTPFSMSWTRSGEGDGTEPLPGCMERTSEGPQNSLRRAVQRGIDRRPNRIFRERSVLTNLAIWITQKVDRANILPYNNKHGACHPQPRNTPKPPSQNSRNIEPAKIKPFTAYHLIPRTSIQSSNWRSRSWLLAIMIPINL